jgi:hypothetical protein
MVWTFPVAEKANLDVYGCTVALAEDIRARTFMQVAAKV